MQKLSLIKTCSSGYRLQQIQFIKLLQIPTVELKQRIEEEEMEINLHLKKEQKWMRK
jgi:RNA polymerase sigma-54 factor